MKQPHCDPDQRPEPPQSRRDHTLPPPREDLFPQPQGKLPSTIPDWSTLSRTDPNQSSSSSSSPSTSRAHPRRPQTQRGNHKYLSKTTQRILTQQTQVQTILTETASTHLEEASRTARAIAQITPIRSKQTTAKCRSQQTRAKHLTKARTTPAQTIPLQRPMTS